MAFTEDQLRGLSADQRRTLVRITAVGLAVRSGDVATLGAPILQRRRQEARVERLRQEVALEREGVDDEVLRARYETMPEWELHVRHLVVLSERWRSDEHRRGARRTAEAALERIEAGEPFPEVAAEVSDEPGAADRGGLLEPGREGTWVREFWEAAARLEPGEVSGVVETEYGFHVLKLEDRRPVPFDEARPRVVGEVSEMVADRGAWEEWVEETLAEMELFPDSLEDAGLVPDGERIVARWGDERFTTDALARALEGLPAEEAERFTSGSRQERAALVEDLARNHFLAAVARRRGIDVPDPEDARLVREWERTVGAWATFFGFEEGMSLDDVRERSLQGLAGTGQNLRIAREEVNRWGRALERAFPIRRSPSS